MSSIAINGFTLTHAALNATQGISPIERLILATLASFSNFLSECWPSNQTLAARTGLHERTVGKAIGKLQEKGLIERKSRGQGMAMLTRILIPLTPPAHGLPPPAHGLPEPNRNLLQIPIQAATATEATDTATPLVCFEQSIEQPIPDTAQPPEWAVSESRDEMLLKAAVQAVETALGRIDTPSIATIEAQQSLQIAPESTQTTEAIQTHYLEVSEAPTQATEEAPTAIEVEVPAQTLTETIAIKDVSPDEVPQELMESWAEVRKAKRKAPKPNKVELQALKNEAIKANMTLSDVVKEMCIRNWSRFKGEWLNVSDQYQQHQHQPVTPPQLWKPTPHTPASPEVAKAALAKLAELRAQIVADTANRLPHRLRQ